MKNNSSIFQKILNSITLFFDIIYRVLLEYAKYILVLIVIIVSTQVVCRKFLNFSFRWAEEVALLFMVWMAFISMAIGVEKNLHVAITMFYDMFPRPVRTVCSKIGDIIITALGIVLMVYGVRLVISTSSSTLPATQWPASFLYLMIPVGGLFTTYFALLNLLGLNRLRHKNIEGEEPENV